MVFKDKTEYHRQCVLERKTKTGRVLLTSWIPLKYAILHKYIKLKNEDNTWTDGWQVISVGLQRSTATAKQQSNDFKHQREVSDI